MGKDCSHKKTCKSCRKQFKDGVSAAYWSGLDHAEAHYIETVNIYKITNKELMEEVKRRDKKEPREGDPNYITIRFRISVLKRLITALRLSKKPHNASFLSNKLKKHDEEMGDQAEKILKHLKIK